MPVSEDDLKLMHDRMNKDHSGKNGHWCAEWDGLYICEDCPEYTVCHCFKHLEIPEEDEFDPYREE